MAEDVRLYLISAKKSRTTGHWPDDDYDVRLGAPDGPDIGRIYGGDVVQNGSWFWSINLGPIAEHWPADRGHAPTREEAMAAFKVAPKRERATGLKRSR